MRHYPHCPPGSTRLLTSCIAALALGACANGSPIDISNEGGSGGTSTGGATGGSGTGGLAATGGLTGTGGLTATGGVKGTGGITATGGVTGTGGMTATGGTGAGGARGGSGGAGGRATGGAGGARATGGISGGNGGATGTGGATGVGGACMPGPTPTGGKTVNGTGTASGGLTYNFYTNGSGSASMTVYGVDGDFSATWSNPGDFLARVGLGWNSTKTYDQLGTITADFTETKSGSGGSWNYIGVYGWSENPLHEYYIVEDWFGGTPRPGTKMGSIMVDGAMYDVYTHQQNNQPAITGGNQTFVQYYSVRQQAHACAHITISDHFAAWAQLGMQLGKMEEARIVIEVGGGGSGNITFTNATVSATTTTTAATSAGN